MTPIVTHSVLLTRMISLMTRKISTTQLERRNIVFRRMRLIKCSSRVSRLGEPKLLHWARSQRKKLPPGVKTNFWRPPTHPPTSFTPQKFKNHENQKNDKIGKTQKRNFGTTKKLKICQKKCFWQNVEPKLFFGDEI